MSLVKPHPSAPHQKEIKTIIVSITPTKESFYTYKHKESFSNKAVSFIPYELGSRMEAMTVGVAFDYIARFLVARKIRRNKLSVLENLVASKAFKRPNLWDESLDLLNQAQLKFSAFEDISRDFISGKSVDWSTLLQLSIFAAKLEQTWRGGKLPQNPETFFEDMYNSEMLFELSRMCEVFDECFIEKVVKDDSDVIFNPTFGIGSQIMGGADADIYIDSTLYDFKTHKTNGYRKSEGTQLIGYYMLDAIAKDCEDSSNKLHNHNIERIAFYKARFGETNFFDISSLNSNLVDQAKTSIKKCYLLHNVWGLNKSDLKDLGIYFRPRLGWSSDIPFYYELRDELGQKKRKTKKDKELLEEVEYDINKMEKNFEKINIEKAFNLLYKKHTLKKN